jgi:hypothetical protein
LILSLPPGPLDQSAPSLRWHRLIPLRLWLPDCLPDLVVQPDLLVQWLPSLRLAPSLLPALLGLLGLVDLPVRLHLLRLAALPDPAYRLALWGFQSNSRLHRSPARQRLR